MKGRPRTTAAQEAERTRSPDLSRRMEGSRRDWGWDVNDRLSDIVETNTEMDFTALLESLGKM